MCGKNGSGKSTWLKVLDLLNRSQEIGLLPWCYHFADREADNIQLTNAFYHAASPEALEKDDDQQPREEFGPPTTIGLEMLVTRDYELDEDEAGLVKHGGGKARGLFWNGICRKGTRLRLRIAHPSYWSDEVKTPTLFHLIELAIDDKFIVRLKGERDPSEGFDADAFRPIRSKLYQLYCSPSIIPGETSSRRAPIHLASVTDLATLTCESAVEHVDSDIAAQVVSFLESRFQQIISEVLRGFFYIGAVREPHNYLSLDELDSSRSSSILWGRHVGISGKHSWILERNLHGSPLRNLGDVSFAADDFYQTPCELLLPDCRDRYPKFDRIWQLADPELKARVSEEYNRHEAELTALHHGVESLDEFEAGEDQLDEEFKELVAALLNRLLDEPQLFEFSTWAEHPEQVYEKTGEEPLEVVDPYISDPEIKYLSEIGPENLSPKQLRRLNYLLIEDAFFECRWDDPPPTLWTDTTYNFGTYVSTWMQRLTDTELADKWSSPPSNNERKIWTRPVNVLPEHTEATGLLLRVDRVGGWKGSRGNEIRCSHPCFGDGESWTQPPRQLSAGFHQILPIIVQLGLMRSGELVGIENPEVHLHPALQPRLTEALIAHVGSGRRMIIETHSDLVIRRVIRAILEEQIAQSQVQVYFTKLQGANVARNRGRVLKHGRLRDYHSSTLTPVRIDERGRIANWPKGFLDEDVRESQRLMDVMYGGSEVGDEDD